ncbi:hypothetical protein KI387_015047, partial [Taxus chinensis]
MDEASPFLTFEASASTQQFLADLLLDQTLPISERFRALFSLRNLRGSIPRDALISATRDSSNLLAHEAAFALGQMQDAEAVPALQDLLLDCSLHPIVRHEAAEALGAIGLDDYVPLLQNSLKSDPAPEVQETCELALKRIEERKSFWDEEKGMYERYASLFALRNRGGAEAVDAIVAALQAQSALLRHEVAYVLGQLQDKVASVALTEILKDVNEHPMVRHEAAEALGSIADNESIMLLKQYEKDPEPIVSQSCEVALSMLQFEQSGKSFE